MNTDTVRQLAWLEQRCDSTTQAVERIHARSPSPEEDDPDLDEHVITGKGTLKPAHVTWTGDTPGVSVAAHARSGQDEDKSSPRTAGATHTAPGGGGFPGGGRRGSVGERRGDGRRWRRWIWRSWWR
jgi:hypothetical protein